MTRDIAHDDRELADTSSAAYLSRSTSPSASSRSESGDATRMNDSGLMLARPTAGSSSIFPTTPSRAAQPPSEDRLSRLRSAPATPLSSSASTTSQSDDEEEVDADDDKDFVERVTASAVRIAPTRVRSSQDLAGWQKDTTRRHSETDAVTATSKGRPSPAEELPPELIVHMLKNLSSSRDLQSALLVSRTWCQCAIPLIWAKPSIPHKEALRKIVHVIRKPSTTFEYAKFIKRINFVNVFTTLQDAQLMEFAACTRVERLTLTSARNIGSATLCHVLSKMPDLVAIDLANVMTTNDDVLKTIAATTTRLQGINLTSCIFVTDEGLIALARASKMLRRLKICLLQKITDRSIIEVAQSCPLILEYDLQHVNTLTDASVEVIWRKSTLLRELRLHGVYDLTGAAFPLPDVAPTMVHIRTLDLTACRHVNDAAIDAIVTNAPKIRNLTLAKCVNLTDAAMDSVCKLGKQLHLLHLGHVALITDAAVCKIARSCTRLRYIDLACCPQLTDMSVFEIASNLTKLRRIGLVKIVNLTDQAIYALVDRGERQPSLERIHLSYCDNLSVPAITYMLARVPHVTHLSLTGVSAFRHKDYQQFCRPAPKEFNAHQRSAFCVFSGKGVQELRDWLLTRYAVANHRGGDSHGGGESSRSSRGGVTPLTGASPALRLQHQHDGTVPADAQMYFYLPPPVPRASRRRESGATDREQARSSVVGSTEFAYWHPDASGTSEARANPNVTIRADPRGLVGPTLPPVTSSQQRSSAVNGNDLDRMLADVQLRRQSRVPPPPPPDASRDGGGGGGSRQA